jgi:predicted porin
MQKKLIALAVAAALASPALALADSANVTVYGKLIADIESVQSDKATGANVPVAAGSSYTVNRVVSNASRLGVKGEEDLGDGMKAFFQIESNVNLTGTDAIPAGSSTMIFDGIRNSGAGIKSDAFGAVSIGNWDTPYKLTHNKIELFDNTTFASATNLIGRAGATTATAAQAATTAANFVTRQAGVVQYYSPKFSGFDVKVAFAPASDTLVVPNNTASKQNKSVVSMSGTFETDDIYVALGYEAHNDAFAPTATRLSTGADTATRLVGSYKIADGFWVGATVEQVSVTGATLVATGTKTSSRTGFELATSYKMDKNNFGLSYAKLGNMGSAASSGANQVSLRYGYDLSKRTQAFAMYSALSNDANGQYALSAGQTIAGAPGAKLSGFGAGLQHTF